MQTFSFRNFLSPVDLLYWRRLLWQSQYYSRDELVALQWRLLRKMLKYCFESVPFYQGKYKEAGLEFGDIRNLDDLPKLPIVRKSDLVRHNEMFRRAGNGIGPTVEVSTSGTSGTPGRLLWDRRVNVMELCCNWRHFSWQGYRLGDPFADLRNYNPFIEEQWKWNYGCRCLEMPVHEMDEHNVSRYADQLRRRGIRFWRGHPHAIEKLGRLMMDTGITDVRPERVCSNSEMILPSLKQNIETVTGCTLCDSYGQMEHIALICQCPAGSYHVASEYGIVEIVKDDGTLARDGESGEIVGSGLHNLAFPLIRYGTGDAAMVRDGYCGCGRTLPVVEKIEGRWNDPIRNAEGKWVTGLVWSMETCGGGIQQSKLIQNASGQLDVYVVPKTEWNSAWNEGIKESIETVTGGGMDIRIHVVESVPMGIETKYKFVVCNLEDKIE